MSFFLSDRFVSICAPGKDWRGAVKNILDALGEQASAKRYDIGFLYITDFLAKDAGSLLTALRSVTGIRHWVGAVGAGVCGMGEACVDEPAISMMLGRFGKEAFKVFPPGDYDLEDVRLAMEDWLDRTEPMLTLVHGDPFTKPGPEQVLKELEQMMGGYLAGGLSASRSEHVQYADQVVRGGVSGVAFSQDVPVISAVSQGCTPFGPIHTVTRCAEQKIQELDGRRALEVMSEDLRGLAEKKRKTASLEMRGLSEKSAADKEAEYKEAQGEIHIGFPVSGSDQGDYLVRNISGFFPDSGELSTEHLVENGQHLVFVHRNKETVQADLSRTLISLRERVLKERGEFSPKGGLYISCVARAVEDFGDADREMDLVREIIGDIPLAGFYAGGEISNNRLYRHTALLILFF